MSEFSSAESFIDYSVYIAMGGKVIYAPPCITVPQFECRKRWQDLSDLSRDLYKYDRVLKKGNRWTDHGEKSLAAKWASAGYKPEVLDARQSTRPLAPPYGLHTVLLKVELYN